MLTLAKRVALVTGAASGIGQATAIRLATLGCSLSLVDLNSIELEGTRQLCLEDHSEADILLQTGDLTDSKDQERVVHDTVEHFGRLDILINCAGIMVLTPEHGVLNASLSELDRTMDINFKSVLRMIQLSAPHLKVTKGRVVNVSSRLAMVPRPNCLPYCVSKAAVDVLTKMAAMELSSFGVRVNSINPSVVNTNLLSANERADEFLEEGAKRTLLGRIAEPEDIAKCIVFLISDDSSYVTGISLIVDGGSSLKF